MPQGFSSLGALAIAASGMALAIVIAVFSR